MHVNNNIINKKTNKYINEYNLLNISVIRQKSFAPRVMSKIVWIDMEMTGLNVRKDKIMEIACLITDNNLNIVAEQQQPIVIHQTNALLESMNEWCQTTHAKVILNKTVNKFFVVKCQNVVDFNQNN